MYYIYTIYITKQIDILYIYYTYEKVMYDNNR